METLIASRHGLDHEKERLARLHGYNIVNNCNRSDTFQHVVTLTANIFEVPMALVNFVGQQVIFTESSIGVEGVREVDRAISICSRAILQDEVTVFENAREDHCLKENPFVHGEFGLQFYAAAPLKTPDGFNIGVLVIVDRKPRAFSKEDKIMLEGLAALIMDELEERRLMSSN